jgi:hypothetical protein
METGKEDALGVAEAVGDHHAITQFEIERRSNQVLRHVAFRPGASVRRWAGRKARRSFLA